MNHLSRALVAAALVFAASGVQAATPASLTDLAQDALVAGQYAAAADLADEAVRAAPDDLQAYLLLGLAHDHLGQYDEAAQAYRVVASHHPDRYRAMLLLARALSRAGDVGAAVEIYSAARALRPPATRTAAR